MCAPENQKRDLGIFNSIRWDFCVHRAPGKKIHDWKLQIKTHKQEKRERNRERKMKCKVFAATTRSSRNMRQMEMEREACSEQQVQLDVKYCVCRFYLSCFLFSLFRLCISLLLCSGDDDNNKSLRDSQMWRDVEDNTNPSLFFF